MPRSICSIYAIVLLCCQTGQTETNWGRFRGPNGTGLSDARTIPTQWTDADYNWRVDLPGVGHSSPVVWGDRVIVTAADPQTASRSVLCLDAQDGRLRWRRDFPSQTYPQHGSNSYAAATPAADQHGIVVTWTTPSSNLLLALDFDGGEQWRRDLGPFIGANGSGTSPILVGDLVILTNDQDDVRFLTRLTGNENPDAPVGKSSVLAVKRQDGETQWELPRETILASYATPCIRTLENGASELILTGTAHGVTGVDLQSGKVNWEIRNLFPERCVGSPVLVGDLVIAGFGRGVHGEECVAARAGSSGSGDDTTVAYRIKQAVPLVPTPVVVDGLVFLWADTGVVSCIRGATGELLWRERVGGDFYGSPVCVDKRIYCIAKNGDVVVIAAAANYQLLARVPLGADSFATPAVANGVMYLRTQSQLFSLGGKSTVGDD